MDRVLFTRPSAERIARVVRIVEQTRPEGAAFASRRPSLESKPRVFRVATFTGAWSIGTSKTVTFKNVTDTPNTASAINLFFPVTSPGSGARDCAIAKEGTAWYLVDVRLATATAIFAGATQLQSVVSAASTSVLTIVNAASTSRITYAGAGGSQTILTAVAASLNTANCSITITPTTASILVAGGTQSATVVSNAATQTVTVVSAASTQNITIVSATYTATFLRLDVQ